MIDKEALISKFASQTKTVDISSIDAEVKIKKLTIAQRQEVNDILFAGSTLKKEGESVEVGVANYNKAAKLGVAYGLVEPKLSKKEIDSLSDSASDFINEVFNAIQEFDEPKK